MAAITYYDQRRLKELTETRYERRYVDRVAWWMGNDFNNPGQEARLIIQNRSTAPLRGIAIQGRYPAGPAFNDGQLIAYATFNIPPCKAVDLPLPKGPRRTGPQTPLGVESRGLHRRVTCVRDGSADHQRR
ncbi:hypothetical protein ACFY36_31830 [Actinoplanes sp. NPDC000266]